MAILKRVYDDEERYDEKRKRVYHADEPATRVEVVRNGEEPNRRRINSY